MIVAIVSFQMPKATTPEDMSGPFKAAVPVFQKVPGLVQAKFGGPPTIDFLNSPAMIDNRDGTVTAP